MRRGPTGRSKPIAKPPEPAGSGAVSSPRTHRLGTRSRGFTLLEALVAFAVAAIALAVLFQGTISGLRAVNVASRTEDAISHARSHLDAAATALGREGDVTQRGDDGGGYRWSLVIHPIGTATDRREHRLGIDPTVSNALTLYRIDVTVTFDGGARAVHLTTERLVIGKPHTA